MYSQTAAAPGSVGYLVRVQLLGRAHLDEVLCVVGAVDADGVLQRGAVGRGEQQQFEAFGGGHAERLSHQGKAAQLLGEHTTRLRLQLAIIRLRHQLLSQHQHILTHTHTEISLLH